MRIVLDWLWMIRNTTALSCQLLTCQLQEVSGQHLPSMFDETEHSGGGMDQHHSTQVLQLNLSQGSSISWHVSALP